MASNCRLFYILIILFTSLQTTSAWLTQSDGYNIGVTLGSAFAALIFLVVLFFILYQCCLKKMLQDYRRDKDTFAEKKGTGSSGPGPLFKKRPQKQSTRDPYFNRTSAEYDVPPSSKLDDSFQHSGGYYSGNSGSHPEEYRSGPGGNGSPVDYDPAAYGRSPADRGHQPPHHQGQRGDMDSSTESKGSVQIAQGDAPRGTITTYGDRGGSARQSPYERDREPSGGRATTYLSTTDSHRGGYVPYGAAAAAGGRGILDRSPAGGRKQQESSSAVITYPADGSRSGAQGAMAATTETYSVGPVTEQMEQKRTAQGGTVTYQTTRTYHQRTVQQQKAAYMGSSV